MRVIPDAVKRFCEKSFRAEKYPFCEPRTRRAHSPTGLHDLRVCAAIHHTSLPAKRKARHPIANAGFAYIVEMRYKIRIVTMQFP